MSLITSRQELTDACVEAFRSWENVESILLFGSRARGTALPDSDWDIAVLVNDPELTCPTQNKRQPARPPLDRYENLDVVTLTPEFLRANLASYGTIAQQIAQDGQPLIGDWEMDQKAIKEKAIISPSDWQIGLVSSCKHIRRSIDEIYDYKQEIDAYGAIANCQSFIMHSQSAAEYLVKALLKRRKIPPKHTHDLERLAQTMRSHAPPDVAASKWSVLSERIEAIDGFTFLDHQAEYHGEDIKVVEVKRAAERLARTSMLFIDEIDSALDPQSHCDDMGLSSNCLGDTVHQDQLKTCARIFPLKLQTLVEKAATVFALPNVTKVVSIPDYPEPARAAKSFLEHIRKLENTLAGPISDWVVARLDTVDIDPETNGSG